METKEKDVVATLEELLKRANSVTEAYHNASKNVHNKPLTEFFAEAADIHENFGIAIKQELGNRGGNTKDKTTTASSKERFWADFASIIVRRNEAGILKSCAKAEKDAIEEYDEVLGYSELSEEFKVLLRQQREKSQQLYDEVTELEKRYASD